MRSVPPPALRSLLEKYVELRRLRTGDDGDEPVLRMRRVAARWPGALREIDELPLEAIEHRIAELEGALDGAEVPSWASPLAEFHGLLRACLSVKREAGRDSDAAVAWVRDCFEPAADEPSKERLLALAARIARPKAGRLSRMVLEVVAERCGLEVEACERLCFPPSPRRRPRA